MELVKRYIYAVTHKLPQQQRADIEKELQSLIEDMVEQRIDGSSDYDSAIEEVLLELGNPNALAAKYRGNPRYLISPASYDNYFTVLKIVIISIIISLTAVFVIDFFLDPSQVLNSFIDYMGSLFNVALQGFAWVTIIFGIIEYAGVKTPKISQDPKKDWKPSMLQPIPHSKAQIKLSEPITGIIFTIIFLVLFTVSDHLLGIIRFNEGQPTTIIPFFNQAVFRGYFPLIWILIALAILRDCLKIIVRKWTMNLVYSHIIINIISFVVSLIIFMNSDLWNSQFLNELVEHGLLIRGDENFDWVSTLWNRTTEGFIYIIGAVALFDTINLCYKAYQLKVHSENSIHTK